MRYVCSAIAMMSLAVEGLGLRAAYSNEATMIVHPSLAPAVSMVAQSGLSLEHAAQQFPFNGGGYNIPGVFGGSGGIGWGLGAAGSPPGYVDATRYGLPADYLLPKNSPAGWKKQAASIGIPLYQGSHIFSQGGFKGMRGPSLQRYKAVNPDFDDPKVTYLNPLNNPQWFFPNHMDPLVAPYHIPSSEILNKSPPQAAAE